MKNSQTARECFCRLAKTFSVNKKQLRNKYSQIGSCYFSIESTRFSNYASDKFDGELTFIKPYFWKFEDKCFTEWKLQIESAEDFYLILISEGATPEQARAILPNSLKTEIVMTANILNQFAGNISATITKKFVATFIFPQQLSTI